MKEFREMSFAQILDAMIQQAASSAADAESLGRVYDQMFENRRLSFPALEWVPEDFNDVPTSGSKD